VRPELVIPFLFHARECDLVVCLALDHKAAPSRRAPYWIGRSDIRANHDIRVPGEARIVKSRSTLGQPHLAGTEVSEYLQVPTAERVAPIHAGTGDRANWCRLMLGRNDEDQRSEHQDGNEVKY